MYRPIALGPVHVTGVPCVIELEICVSQQQQGSPQPPSENPWRWFHSDMHAWDHTQGPGYRFQAYTCVKPFLMIIKHE